MYFHYYFALEGYNEAKHCTKRFEPERYWPSLEVNMEWFDVWLMGGPL